MAYSGFLKSTVLLCVAFGITGCSGTRDYIRSKDFRDDSPTMRATGAASPIANVHDMPGWTTDVDSAIAFATENPQKTVLFVQRSGDPATDTLKSHLNTPEAERATADKQKVTLNIDTAPGAASRFGITQAPAVVMVGPGGIPESQKTGTISKAELLKYLK